jgi:hypothetical protein
MRKIYFICKGVSCNNILDSKNKKNTNKSSTSSPSFFNFFDSTKKDQQSSIKKLDFSKLEYIGIKEMLLCQENTDNDKYIKNIADMDEISIFTSLDYSAIESALVAYYKNINYTIYPILNISKKTNIKSEKEFDIFKKNFGYKQQNNIAKKYWNLQKLDDEFFYLKNMVPKISWKYTADASKISLNTYSLKSFIKFLEGIFRDSKYNDKKLIFVCDNILIRDFLKLVNKKKANFSNKTDVIEYSSIWEVELITSINGTIKVDDFTKIYPTPYNHSKLKYDGDNDTYSYEYNQNRFNLFNSFKTIPESYISKLGNSRCLNNIATLRINIDNKTNKSDNRKNINTNSVYETLFKIENSK